MGKRIVFTGGSGKAGKHVVPWLKAKGYDYRYVYSLAAKHTDPRVFEQTLADTLVWMWRGYQAE